MSRGAARAVLVEKDCSSAAVIISNIKLCGLSECAEVLNLDAAKAIKLLGERKENFDLIFIDPPYKKGFEVPSLEKIQGNGLLNVGGIVVVESNKCDLPPERVGQLMVYRRERYGDTALTFYRHDI
ncbi:hypothetical protein N752_13100 [Desulforamulus aquiferis]|nr:hypothetical protein N752_13100 [Desulforamulus aquiferis]